ncbi:MAG: cupin domain-containing protein, partial [Alphaproteobacteria bacterium]
MTTWNWSKTARSAIRAASRRAYGPVGQAIGAQKLGSRLVVVPPGKRAWQFHLHHANEEMFVILTGTGTLRYGEDRFPLREGDVVAAPPGTGKAHQIVNDSDSEL